MLDVRFVNPTISFAEKFMDHAFLASVIRNPVVPPLDPWFGGGTLNVYYYLGYWLFGCLAIVSGVPSNIAFNLALPTVFALAAVNVYAIGTLLLERFRWLPLLVFFLPNPVVLLPDLAQGKAMSSILWDSTRTITNTINEYPLFSFLWGDVHAHVVSIFNQVFLLFLLLFAYKQWESLESRSRWILCLLVRPEPGLHAALQHLGRAAIRTDHPRLRITDPVEKQGRTQEPAYMDIPCHYPSAFHSLLPAVLSAA